jgi:2-oxoglutarate dehydrogenase E2 component (dihydrolipoamide succinyltransferase)
LILNIIK